VRISKSLSSGISLLLFWTANTANAVSVSATGILDVSGSNIPVTTTNTSTLATTSSGGTVFSGFTTGGWVDSSVNADGTIRVQAFGGDATGFLNGATSWDASATGIWSDVLTNTTTNTQTYTLDFLIPGAGIDIGTGGSPGPNTAFASFFAEIKTDTTTLFSSSASLDDLSGLTTSGTSLNGTFVDNSTIFGDVFAYDWNTFSATVNFDVPANSSVNLSYVVTATTNGIIEQPLTIEDRCAVNTAGGYACFGQVLFDEPYGTDVITSLQLTSVPIPATAWLFGSGLMGIASMSRRKKSA